jgi:hypothetical protein
VAAGQPERRKQRAYRRGRGRARAGRQRRAAKLLAQGLKQLEVAAAVDVSARTLRNWSKTLAFQRALAHERARAERARTERQKPGRLAGRNDRQTAEARTAGAQEAVAGAAEIGNLRESGLRGDRSARGRSRKIPPLELEPFSVLPRDRAAAGAPGSRARPALPAQPRGRQLARRVPTRAEADPAFEAWRK